MAGAVAVEVRWAPTALLAVGPLIFVIWAVIDAARQPGWAWKRTRHRQWLWVLICLAGFGVFAAGIGVVWPVGALAYLTVRPTVRRARAMGPPPPPGSMPPPAAPTRSIGGVGP